MEPQTSSCIYKMSIFAVLTTNDIVRLELPLQITKTFTSWTVNSNFLFLASPKGPTAPKLLHNHSSFSLSAFSQQVIKLSSPTVHRLWASNKPEEGEGPLKIYSHGFQIFKIAGFIIFLKNNVPCSMFSSSA